MAEQSRSMYGRWTASKGFFTPSSLILSRKTKNEEAADKAFAREASEYPPSGWGVLMCEAADFAPMALTSCAAPVSVER
ncbi:hypothetical protein [Streptomyces albidochromogenes]|uniref:Uncharacterized protein n=1 Tax=Streptomyces albidochromogenes TaxID=329524 RepID=A0ABW6FFY7_9ACTN